MTKETVKTKPPMPAGPKMGLSNLDESVVPREPMSEEPVGPVEPPMEPTEPEET